MAKTAFGGRAGRAVVAGCGLALAFGVVQPAQAQDDEPTFEQRLIRSILGGNDSSIDYRERSPLVIPPSTELPAPDASTASATPRWPNDPDLARQKASASGGSGPITDVFERAARPLSREELRRGTVRGAGRSNEPVRTLSDAEAGRALSPAELGETRTLFGLVGRVAGTDKPEPFQGEPSRSRLVEPPSGYRTPAATQPYAPPTNQGTWYKPFSWFDWGTDRRQ